jgi:DNA-binding CsgD family transcriptional regulator
MPSGGEVADLIAALYDAGIEPERWPNALERFAALFGASYGGLVLAGPRDRVAQIGSASSDPTYSRSYGEYYGRMDPVIPAAITASAGTMITDTMVIPKVALERTEFHQDWVRPQGYYSALAANFIRNGDNVGVAVLSRRQPEEDFLQDDLDLLAVLIPHLQRTVRMQWHLSSLQAERNSALEALDRLSHGIVVTDQSCRIMLANRAAEEILAQSDGIGSGSIGLRTAKAAQTSELRRLISGAAGAGRCPPVGGTLLVDRPSTKKPFQVLVSPLRADIGWMGMSWQTPTVLVLMIDPERETPNIESRLRTLFGLTRTEARLAREIAAGEGLISVAESLGVLPSTARTHLHRVFEKTETKRQAELVKVVEHLAVLSTDEA